MAKISSNIGSPFITLAPRFFRDESNMRLLENDSVTLEDAGFRDEDSILVRH
jgi:hypothetical protein